MINKVFITGRLTREPELRFMPSGTPVVSFTIAVNRPFKVKDEWKEETYYFDVEVFGSQAEKVVDTEKGQTVLVEGQLRQDRWESSSGEKRSKVKIVSDRVVKIANGKKEPNTETEK